MTAALPILGTPIEAEIQRLMTVTAALARGVPPREALSLALKMLMEVANGSRVTVLVTRDQAGALVPDVDLASNEILLAERTRLAWAGPDADAIRDWEGANTPFHDGRRLVLPVEAGGVAIENPSCDPSIDPMRGGILAALVHLAVAAVRSSERQVEQQRRTSALENTRRRLREQTVLLQELAVVDELTGLRNRRFFQQRLHYEFERYLRYDQQLAIVMLDVDHFKQVNDTYGHTAGDEVLRTLGALAKEAIRSVDAFCRYGGEEFVVLMPNTDESGAALFAERLRVSIESKISIGERVITVSFGVATATPELSDSEALIRAADSALYAAKRRGRNRVICVSEIHP